MHNGMWGQVRRRPCGVCGKWGGGMLRGGATWRATRQATWQALPPSPRGMWGHLQALAPRSHPQFWHQLRGGPVSTLKPCRKEILLSRARV